MYKRFNKVLYWSEDNLLVLTFSIGVKEEIEKVYWSEKVE